MTKTKHPLRDRVTFKGKMRLSAQDVQMYMKIGTAHLKTQNVLNVARKATLVRRVLAKAPLIKIKIGRTANSLKASLKITL